MLELVSMAILTSTIQQELWTTHLNVTVTSQSQILSQVRIMHHYHHSQHNIFIPFPLVKKSTNYYIYRGIKNLETLFQAPEWIQISLGPRAKARFLTLYMAKVAQKGEQKQEESQCIKYQLYLTQAKASKFLGKVQSAAYVLLRCHKYVA